MQSTPKTRQQATNHDMVRIGSVLSRPKRVSDSPPPEAKHAKKTLASIHFPPEQKRSEIFRAVTCGDEALVQELIQDVGPEVREADTNNTLLHASTEHLHLSRTLLILISPNTTNAQGQTPAHLAALKGHLDVLELLIKDEQFKKDKKDKDGRTYKEMLSVPLVKAISQRSTKTMERLLGLGANPDLELDGILVRELDITTPRKLADTMAVGLWKPEVKQLFSMTRDPSMIQPVRKKAKDFNLSISKDNLKVGPLRLTITPALDFLVPNTEDTYSMSSDPRGFVCVLSYSSFNERQDLALEGAGSDVANLEHVFGRMGYVGHTFTNMSAEQTRDALEDMRSLDILEDVGCAVFIVSSHGANRQTFLTSDMEVLEAQWLIDFFRDSQCPQLKGKPKLFVFDITTGFHKDDRYPLQVPSTPGDDPARDSVCIYTSSSGHTSYIHNKDGTPFISSFCKSLANHASTKEFGDLYRELLKEYGKSVPSTVPELRYLGLAKKFYLNPRTPSPLGTM